MTKTTAIKRFCLECSGDSPLTVTLCSSFDCPLWPWRLGASTRTKEYRLRMESAIQNHPEYVKELSEIGVDINRFSLKQGVSVRRIEKLRPAYQNTGGDEKGLQT